MQLDRAVDQRPRRASPRGQALQRDLTGTVCSRHTPDMTPTGPLPVAVLWDMDGTIVDTEQFWIEAEYRLVAEHGGTWSPEHAEQLIGRNLHYSADYLREHGGVDLPNETIVHTLQDSVIAAVRGAVPWRPGALDLLARLKAAGVPQALVTMSWSGLANAIADQVPAGTFATVVSGDRVTDGKPHPEPYLLAMSELNVGPEGVVAIEDSPTGLTSAEAAGVHVIGVPHLVELDGSRYRVAALTDLTPETLLPATRASDAGPPG